MQYNLTFRAVQPQEHVERVDMIVMNAAEWPQVEYQIPEALGPNSTHEQVCVCVCVCACACVRVRARLHLVPGHVWPAAMLMVVAAQAGCHDDINNICVVSFDICSSWM